jgi:mediator of RNA polymerase II transcription subunit 12
VTFNDPRKVQFLLDLGNTSIPLSRLMVNSVPHGWKGVELLEAMYSSGTAVGTGQNRALPGAKIHSEPIPIDRALWFVRVVGVAEIVSHRARVPAPGPIQTPSPAAATPSSTTTVSALPALVVSSNDWWTQEFTVVFTTWLRNQLAQLVLPPALKPLVKPGVPLPKAVGILGDKAGRARWIAKWTYG